MIRITDKKDCCGCTACVERCPEQCIQMKADAEGFLYPIVDDTICIDCGICEKVCPVLNICEKPEYDKIKAFAAKNKNKGIRLESSSGGIFSILAEKIILEGGVVFGAKFDSHWEVVHSYSETVEGLSVFRGSKYVQSKVKRSFTDAEQFLKSNRKVLFSGTPCQISGLKHFLKKEYANLLAVDFICHGVPSPKVFHLYLDELLKKNSCSINEVARIGFRDKTEGWKRYSLIIKFKKNSQRISLRKANNKDVFLKTFCNDLYLRPSCYSCPCKELKSGSDITIADFWGIEDKYPLFDDNKGVSLVLVNSLKGTDIWNEIDKEAFEVPINNWKFNGNLMKSAPMHPKRQLFFDALDRQDLLVSDIILKYSKLTLKQHFQRMQRWIIVNAKKILKAFGLLDFVKKILKKEI